LTNEFEDMTHLPDLALNPETKLFQQGTPLVTTHLAAVASWLSKMARLAHSTLGSFGFRAWWMTAR
jgi:hypothetical protein